MEGSDESPEKPQVIATAQEDQALEKKDISTSGDEVFHQPQSAVRAVPPPASFQEELIMEYDVQRYRFLQVLHNVLNEPSNINLAGLHKTPYAQQIILNFKRNPMNVESLGPRGNPWKKRFHACPQRAPQIYSEFMEIYYDFVQNVILSHLDTDGVAFQSCPTFRCHLPECGAPGIPHRDEDYRHPQSEVNFWIPLTPVFGSNGLYAESKRDAGDFKPFELSYGKLVRFYANQVWHYTVPNDTDSTRVSIDFRVIREQEWTPASFTYFKLGGYYSVMRRDGLVPQSSPEMHLLQDMYGCPPPQRKFRNRVEDT